MNWQDKKYTPFFIRYSQNIRSYNAMGGDELITVVFENIGLKVHF